MANYKWFFEIFDKISGPSEKMADKQAKLQSRLEDSKKGVAELEAKVASAARKLEGTKLEPKVVPPKKTDLPALYNPDKKVGALSGIAGGRASALGLVGQGIASGPSTDLTSKGAQEARDKFAVKAYERMQRERSRAAERAARDAARQEKEQRREQERTEKHLAQMKRYEAQLARMRQRHKDLEAGMKGTETSAGGVGGAFSFLGAGLPGLIAGVVALTVAFSTLGIAAGVVGGKWAINTLAMKESTLATLKVTTGSVQEADRIFKEALVFAKKTPFETGDVVQGYTSLLGAGFSTDQVGKVYSALGDVAAMSGFDKYVIDRMTLSFAQIKAKGKLQGEELLQILEASGKAGVGATRIYEQIAKRLGIASTDVADAISKGKVDSDTGILAILGAIQERSGGKVGNLMMEQSTTIKGLLSTLMSAPEDLMLSIDLDKLPGLKSFKDAVVNITKLMDTSTESGRRLQGVMTSMFNVVFTGLFGDLGGSYDDIEKKTLLIIKAMEDYVPVLKSAIATAKEFVAGLWEGSKGFFEGLSDAFGLAAKNDPAQWREFGKSIGEAVGKLIQLIVKMNEFAEFFTWRKSPTNQKGMFDDGYWKDFFTPNFYEEMQTPADTGGVDAMRERGIQMGRAVGDGFKIGVATAQGGVNDAMWSMADQSINTFKDKTEIHSPSEVFRRFGGDIAAGLTIGVDESAPTAAGAISNLAQVPDDMPGSAALGAGATAAAPQVHVHFHIQGQPDMNVIDQMREMARQAVFQAFADLATQMGKA